MVFQRSPETKPEHVHAASAGYLAREAMAHSRRATVLGVTSRGLFLRSDSRWLIFVSYERYRSPFTITLMGSGSGLRSVKTKTVVEMQPEQLVFPASALHVCVAPAVAWRPAPARGARESFSRQMARLRSAADVALGAGRDRGLGPLLGPLLSGVGESALTGEERRLLATIRQMQQAGAGEDSSQAGDAASNLLGLGRGLTASGDDFLLGFLLLLNRWSKNGRPKNRARALWLRSLNRVLVNAAYRKTTTLSANLIECAVRGESDERLVAMADCIAVGTPAVEDCVGPLLGWGASSGVDALVGMATALLVDAES